MRFRNFVHLLFKPPRHRIVPDESLDSLLKTVKDAVHVRGGDLGGIPVAGNSEIYKMVAEGHRNYTNSFNSGRRHS